VTLTGFEGVYSRLRRLAGVPAGWLWLLPLAFLAYFFFYPLGSIFFLAGQVVPGGSVQIDFWRDIWPALSFTVWQAVLSTMLTLVVGLPAAFLFARFHFPGKSLLRIMTTLPFILPTVVVAAGFNALVGPHGWVNLLLMDLFNLGSPPIQLLNGIGVILLAHVF
jgi:thiamine transport system permease protein